MVRVINRPSGPPSDIKIGVSACILGQEVRWNGGHKLDAFCDYYPGEAMDRGRVLGLGRAVQVPAGNFTDCLETEDWNPLEGGSIEHKFYCRGVGLVKEVGGSDVVVLTQITAP